MNKLSLSCIFAASGIGLGAFGAHSLEQQLIANQSLDTWHTAVLYHLIHAIALLVLASSSTLKSKWTFRLWSIGILLFSGSLYALALTKWSLLGPITPLGGVAFIAGWACLALENKKPRD